MKIGLHATPLLFFSLALRSVAGAQAIPAATQPIHLSAFGAATGTYTGLDSGKNLGITAGIDISLKPLYRFYPSIEGRGTYPIHDGVVDAQKNVLGGIKVERYYGPIHPYADFLFGRGKITYESGGYPNPAGTLLYLDSISNVFAMGGGADITLTPSFALKVDGQYQHYDTPVTSTGHLYAKALSLGVVYRIDFNHHIHYDRNGQVKGYRPPPPPPVPTPETTPPPPDAGASASPATPLPASPAPDTTPAPAPDATAPAAPAPAPDATAPANPPASPSPQSSATPQ